METTSVDTAYYRPGNLFLRIPLPSVRLYKMMPCGHLGLFFEDRWTCQTCWGFELQEVKG